MSRACTSPSGSPLCRTFQVLARQIWKDLRDSSKANLLRGEETITDDLLLALARRHPREVKIKQFNKRQEKSTGADWEWWFGDGIRWFGIRTQAKRLDIPNLHYKNITRNIGKTGRKQIDRLIKDAHSNQCYPAFCFYNYWCESQYDPIWKCGTLAPVRELLGCTVADASAVKHSAKTVTPLAAVDKVAWPWMCLVCCQGFSPPGATLPQRASDFIHQMAENTDSIPEIADKLPEYVSQSLDKRDLGQGDFADDPELAGVVVINEEDSNWGSNG